MITPKVSKEQFIYAIINNNENKNAIELATELGISVSHFNNLRKKYKIEHKDKLKEIAQEYSMEQIANLRKSANEGNVKAQCVLLEIAELYDPHKKIGEQGQMHVHLYVSGLDVPKDAGRSDAVLTERAGKEVNIPADDYGVIEKDKDKIDKAAENW